jgi:type II restriction enzyme
MIGPDARIKIVQDGELKDQAQAQVQGQFKSFSWMRHASWRNRGWTADVLRCIREIGKTQLTLQDVYVYEGTLQKLHPENKFVRPKIRQQLQVLRDRGFLKFTRPGCYEILTDK